MSVSNLWLKFWQNWINCDRFDENSSHRACIWHRRKWRVQPFLWCQPSTDSPRTLLNHIIVQGIDRRADVASLFHLLLSHQPWSRSTKNFCIAVLLADSRFKPHSQNMIARNRSSFQAVSYLLVINWQTKTSYHLNPLSPLSIQWRYSDRLQSSDQHGVILGWTMQTRILHTLDTFHFGQTPVGQEPLTEYSTYYYITLKKSNGWKNTYQSTHLTQSFVARFIVYFLPNRKRNKSFFVSKYMDSLSDFQENCR